MARLSSSSTFLLVAMILGCSGQQHHAALPDLVLDFVLLGSEVNPVLKALRENGIEVTALHSHMIDDSPHLFFMHFWANDDAQKRAQGLRAALDRANVKRGS